VGGTWPWAVKVGWTLGGPAEIPTPAAPESGALLHAAALEAGALQPAAAPEVRRLWWTAVLEAGML